jgi:ABC-2 type transport system permease protein
MGGASFLTSLWLWRKTHNYLLSGALFLLLISIIGVLYLIFQYDFVNLLPRILTALSLSARYDNFLRGVIRISDIVFYLSFTAFFVYLSVWRLQEQRYGE